MGKVRPRIVMDCDGVLADFTGALRVMLSRVGVELTVDKWDFLRDLAPANRRLVYQMVESRGFCEGLPVLGMEAEVLRQRIGWLRETADVVICTSPWDSSDHWIRERRRWVERMTGIPGGEVVFARRKELVSGDLFVDDRRKNVAAWAAAHPGATALLWPGPHNRDPSDDGGAQVVELTYDPEWKAAWAELRSCVKIEVERASARRTMEQRMEALLEENRALRKRLADVSWTAGG